MKTPMTELLEWVRATFPMDLDTPRLIEEKIQSMLEKERDIICEFGDDYSKECMDSYGYWLQSMSPDRFFELTFETEEK